MMAKPMMAWIMLGQHKWQMLQKAYPKKLGAKCESSFEPQVDI
jgi:hypothetical protein